MSNQTFSGQVVFHLSSALKKLWYLNLSINIMFVQLKMLFEIQYKSLKHVIKKIIAMSWSHQGHEITHLISFQMSTVPFDGIPHGGEIV